MVTLQKYLTIILSVSFIVQPSYGYQQTSISSSGATSLSLTSWRSANCGQPEIEIPKEVNPFAPPEPIDSKVIAYRILPQPPITEVLFKPSVLEDWHTIQLILPSEAQALMSDIGFGTIKPGLKDFWGIRRVGADLTAQDFIHQSSGNKIALLDTGFTFPTEINEARTGTYFKPKMSGMALNSLHGTHVLGTLLAPSPIGVAGSSKFIVELASYLDTYGIENHDKYQEILNTRINSLLQTGKLRSIGASLKFGDNAGYVSLINSLVNKKDLAWINASGNEFADLDTDYTRLVDDHRVLLIGSETASGSKSEFSNYGKKLFAVAPGEDIASALTTDPEHSGVNEEISKRIFSFNSPAHSNERLLALDGTSMANPIFHGIYATLFDINPQLTTDEAIQILRATAIDLGQKGRDIYFGYGQVNGYAAATVAQLMKTTNFASALGKLPSLADQHYANFEKNLRSWSQTKEKGQLSSAYDEIRRAFFLSSTDQRFSEDLLLLERQFKSYQDARFYAFVLDGQNGGIRKYWDVVYDGTLDARKAYFEMQRAFHADALAKLNQETDFGSALSQSAALLKDDVESYPQAIFNGFSEDINTKTLLEFYLHSSSPAERHLVTEWVNRHSQMNVGLILSKKTIKRVSPSSIKFEAEGIFNLPPTEENLNLIWAISSLTDGKLQPTFTQLTPYLNSSDYKTERTAWSFLSMADKGLYDKYYPKGKIIKARLQKALCQDGAQSDFTNIEWEIDWNNAEFSSLKPLFTDYWTHQTVTEKQRVKSLPRSDEFDTLFPLIPELQQESVELAKNSSNQRDAEHALYLLKKYKPNLIADGSEDFIKHFSSVLSVIEKNPSGEERDSLVSNELTRGLQLINSGSVKAASVASVYPSILNLARALAIARQSASVRPAMFFRFRS